MILATYTEKDLQKNQKNKQKRDFVIFSFILTSNTELKPVICMKCTTCNTHPEKNEEKTVEREKIVRQKVNINWILWKLSGEQKKKSAGTKLYEIQHQRTIRWMQREEERKREE